jgi:hypothetical protein
VGVVLSFHRTAVIIPAGFGDSLPGSKDWDAAVSPIRAHRVAIYVLTPVGPVPEAYALHNPFLFEFDVESAIVQREALLRIATWVALYGPQHEKVVLVARGPLMRVWSVAVRKLPQADRVEVLYLRRSRVGLRDSVFCKQLARRVAAR